MESDIVYEGYLTKAPPLDQPRSVSVLQFRKWLLPSILDIP